MTEDSNDNKIDLTQIKWYRINSPLQNRDIDLLNQLSYPLPKRYIKLLKISNGGRLEKDAFNFYDEFCKYDNSNCAGRFCSLLEIKDGYNSIMYCNMN